ncbi:MAG: glycosyltransferase family 4 protein, partial [Calditrichota bacterium]
LEILVLEQKGLSTGGHLDHVVPALLKDYRVNYLKTTDLEEARQAIQRADLIWLEWASQLTAAVTRKVPELQSKPVICRLHGFEVFTSLPRQINWTVVDKLIFVANHKRDLFHQRFPKVDVDQAVIRNGVNLDQFSIPEKKQNTKNLLLLGHINYRKGLTLLLQFYHELLKRDPDFDLYIRGDWQDPRYKMAIMTMVKELGLEKKVTFVEEWIDDLNAWLADKSHILSFSLEESFHYAIGNGMAAGMKPVIHAWNESREIWPARFIFRDLDEFLGLITEDSYDPTVYRKLLIDHRLTANHQLQEITGLLSDLSANIEPSAWNSFTGRPGDLSRRARTNIPTTGKNVPLL